MFGGTHSRRAGLMPAGAVEHDHDVGVRGDLAANLLKM
jgi:hypothetical protein